MATIVDTFNRDTGSGGGLGTTSDGSATWVQDAGAWRAYSASGGKATLDPVTQSTTSIARLNVTSADGTFVVTPYVITFGAGGDAPSIFFRYTDASNYLGVAFSPTPAGGGTGSVSIIKMMAGVQTTLASVSGGVSAGPLATTIQLIGPHIRVDLAASGATNAQTLYAYSTFNQTATNIALSLFGQHTVGSPNPSFGNTYFQSLSFDTSAPTGPFQASLGTGTAQSEHALLATGTVEANAAHLVGNTNDEYQLGGWLRRVGGGIAIAQAQWLPGTSVTTATPTAVTLASTVQPGQVVIYTTSSAANTVQPATITGLSNGAWFLVTNRTANGTAVASDICYGATGGNTLSFTWTANGTVDIWVAVLDGVDPNVASWPSNTLAQNSVQVPNTASITATAGQFIIGAIALNTSTTPTSTPDTGAGWITLNSTPSSSFVSYAPNATAGTYQHQVNTTPFVNSTGMIIALNPATSAYLPPTPTTNDAYDTAVLGDAPTGYWKLDEAAGTTYARDYSGNERHATIAGTVTRRAAGPNGVLANVMGFTGSATDAGHVQLNPSATATSGNGLTVEFWAKHTNVVNERFFDFGNGQQNNNLLATPYTSSGQVGQGVYNASNGTTYVYTGSPQPAATYWHHYAFVWDPFSYQYGQLEFYFDGVLYQSTNISSSFTWQNFPRYFNYIGRSNWAADPYFNGQMSRFAIYQKVLTPTQVATHYAAASPTTMPEAGHIRLTRQYAEAVVKVIPHLRLTRQYIETVRKLELHAVAVSVVIAVKPVLYMSNQAAPALRHRTTSATSIVAPAGQVAISPASATATRHRITTTAVAQTFSSTATPRNATATATRARIATGTMIASMMGDNLADAIDPSSGAIVSIPMDIFSREAGEIGYNAGNTGWLRWTATLTGTASLVIDQGGNVGSYPFIAFFESSVPHATSFSQLTEISRGGWYGTGYIANYPVVNGHTYYWQVDDYYQYQNNPRLHMLPPPVSVYTSSTTSRHRTTSNSQVNAGPFTNYVNIGSSVPYVYTFTGRTHLNMASSLSLDASVGTSTTGGADTTQVRTASGVVTVDTPIVDVPAVVAPTVATPPAPTVTIGNQGTGSLIGGDWLFYVAYYVGDPTEGRFTVAGDSTLKTLPSYDAPPGPVVPPPPGTPDPGPPPTTVNGWGDTLMTPYNIQPFTATGANYLFTYNTATGDNTYSTLASDGPGVYWDVVAADDVTMSFVPIQPANGTCIWELYTADSQLVASFDSADPNLAPFALTMLNGDVYYITSRFYDATTVGDPTGSASFQLIVTYGGVIV